MAIRASKKSLSGVTVPHCKNTAHMQSVHHREIPVLTVLMQQHIGSPCEPSVQKGDTVKMGDTIGLPIDSFSVPIHAPCSGTVLQIEEHVSIAGDKIKAIVIQNDMKYEISDSVQPPAVHNKQEFLDAVCESGAVGLGGAAFPVHMKLAYRHVEHVDTLIVNAAECEPYITSDHRACLEDTADIVRGIQAVQQFLNITNVYVGVESNKPDVLQLLDQKLGTQPHCHVVKLKSRYPQGAEKALIYAATGITITAGMLPADCGVIVMNVSTLAFLGSYLITGMPLVSRRVTIDGDCVSNPNNVIAPIGTPLRDLLELCNTSSSDVKKILQGGPMMGIAVASADTPLIKNNNGILAFSKREIPQQKTTACIRCGRCVGICPMNLMPVSLEQAYDRRDVKMLESLSLSLCINCGCCSFVCPAKRPLAQKHQLAKAFVKAQEKSSVNVKI